MKILVSLILFWAATSQAACHFNSSYRKIYSLSGPVTKIFEELNLLHASELKGLSIFYPIPESFRGEKIPGGVFLSPAKLDEMKDAVVFFDESQELRKLFRARSINAAEIRSRNQTPGEVTETVLKVLGKYVSECDAKKVREKYQELEKRITQKMKARLEIVFFLGEVRKEKVPEFIIANDGLVLWLRKMKLISSYPSELGYVNWAGSILEDMKNKALFLGLMEGNTPKVIGNRKRANLIYPGALIPGIGQLEAWNYFLDHQPR